jgi:hypothetical protein
VAALTWGIGNNLEKSEMTNIPSNALALHNQTITTSQPNAAAPTPPGAQGGVPVFPTSPSPTPSDFTNNTRAQSDFANKLNQIDDSPKVPLRTQTPEEKKAQHVAQSRGRTVANSPNTPTNKLRLPAKTKVNVHRHDEHLKFQRVVEEKAERVMSLVPELFKPRSPVGSTQNGPNAPLPASSPSPVSRGDFWDVEDHEYEVVDGDDDDPDVVRLTPEETEEVNELIRNASREHQQRFPDDPSSRNNSGGDRNT